MFKSNFLKNYLKEAPIALSIERSEECSILSEQNLQRPILDIGCGDGVFASLLFNEPLETGIDPNLVEIERCRKTNSYKELILCKGNAIPKADGSYNTIMSNSVLEHIHDLKPVIQEAHRLLSKSGSFFVTVPSHNFEKASLLSRFLGFLGFHSLQEKFNIFYNKFWNHYHYYDPQIWKKQFTDCGFKVIECKEYQPMALASFNDFFVPFAIPSFFTRKFLKRWFISPFARRLIAPILYCVIQPFYLKFKIKNDEKTLIFMHLKKDDISSTP